MVSSAVYRYFPSRDELLTALIVDAYDAVGAAAEAGARREPGARRRGALARGEPGDPRSGRSRTRTSTRSSTAARFPATPRRRTRSTPRRAVALALLQIVVDGVARARSPTATRPTVPPRSCTPTSPQLRDVAAPGVPDAVLSRTLLAWSQLFGSISLEMFGHLHNVIHDYDAFFDLQMRRAADFLVSGTAAARPVSEHPAGSKSR